MNERCFQAPPQIVIATAGHVDHGKSALLHALTGATLDRLPAERARGLTIQLGYAFAPGAEYQQEVDLGFIDCPGHARFIRQAIAGLKTMHGALLVVAANEGPQAQTLEHLAILRLLSLRWGMVVISKADLVSSERAEELSREMQLLTAGTVFAQQPAHIVSAHQGLGIAALRQHLFREAGRESGQIQRAINDPMRLAVDRSFSRPGHGTVVTGTLAAGSLRLGQRIQVYPGPTTTVRGLQVRGLSVETAIAGQRVAVCLSKLSVGDVPRGCWLAGEDCLSPSTVLDVQLLPLADGPGLRHGQQLQVHHGTTVLTARLSLYGAQEANEGVHHGQLRLAEAGYFQPDDRLILRRASPSTVIGGGQVLALDAPRHRRFHPATEHYFKQLQGHTGLRLLSWLEGRHPQPGTPELAERALGGAHKAEEARRRAGDRMVVRILPRGEQWWSRTGWQRLGDDIISQLSRSSADGIQIWHSTDHLRQICAPDCPEMAWDDRIHDLHAQGQLLRLGRQLCAHRQLPDPPPRVLKAAQRLLTRWLQCGLQAPFDHPFTDADPQPADARRALALAEARGWVIRLDQRRCVHRQVLTQALEVLITTLSSPDHPGIDVQWFKGNWGLTRRDAIPLAEWCDQQGITHRQGNVRLLVPGILEQPVTIGQPYLPGEPALEEAP